MSPPPAPDDGSASGVSGNSGVRLGLLGPVRAWRDGTELGLGSPAQRALLAVLMVAAGRPVTLAGIVDVLWAGEQPKSSTGIVHHYVSRLRRLLEPDRPPRDPGRWIERTGGGYRLVDHPGSSDLLDFRALVARARDLAGDDPAGATGVLVEALALWQGPAGSGLEPDVRAHSLFAELNREHASAIRTAADLALADGTADAAQAVLPSVEQAAGADPLDESLQARLMLVLGASGQRAAALDAYRRGRQQLIDELGIEPGEQMQAAHRLLLRAEPTPAPFTDPEHRERRSSPREPVLRPAQLPPRLSAFTGREEEVEFLIRISRATAGAGTLTAVTGMGGVGKTTLAVRCAHEIAGDYPDGQLYVDLHGFDPANAPLSPAEALRGFLITLGIPGQNVPDELGRRQALFRSVLTGRRMLLLLDNARDAEQIRPLLPGTPGNSVVVTSRSRLDDLAAGDGAQVINLDVFGPAASRAFLTDRIGAARAGPEPDAVEAIVAVCGGLPLALAVVAARITTHPTFPLASVAEEVGDGADLDAFSLPGANRDVRAVFSWSYRNLSPSAAALFRHLALHPGPDFAVAAVASLAGTGPEAARARLHELRDAHLIAEDRPGRYRFHDLVRAYAAELAQHEDDQDARDLIVRRILDHYLHTAVPIASIAYPIRSPIHLDPPADGVTPVTVSDEDSANAWLDVEYPNLMAMVECAADAGADAVTWQLSWALNPYQQEIRGRLRDSISNSRRALEAATRHGEQWWIGYLNHTLGRSHLYQGELETARSHFEQAVAVGRATEDSLRTARGLLAVALTHTGGRSVPGEAGVEQAHPYAREALELYRSLDSDLGRHGEATVHPVLGWYALYHDHDYQAAVGHFQAAVETHRRMGYRVGEAWTWREMAMLHERAGAGAEGVRANGTAIEVGEHLQDLRIDAVIGLFKCYRLIGDQQAATDARAEALRLMEVDFHPEPERLRAELDLPLP